MSGNSGAKKYEESEVYDRQIRLWGVEAQRRMQSSKVLICGITALQAEVSDIGTLVMMIAMVVVVVVVSGNGRRARQALLMQCLLSFSSDNAHATTTTTTPPPDLQEHRASRCECNSPG